jgi:TPR repeat protein/predicted Ser/Thr protein kinase
VRIGRYLIEAELGRGGMGVVYRALDPAGRPVALKLLSSKADAEHVLRFLREGELAARLRHPAIVTVHEALVHEGRPALVYELVPGPTLHDAWGALDRPARLELLRQVAHGVAHAHERGVVHRDLKGENVVVGETGPKVIDFGLATASDLERLTRTGAAMGTPHAMAPEQLGAVRDELGPWTDVWALGVLLHEALLDRPPFEAAGLTELLAQVASARVVPPRKFDRSVSPALEAVCLRCLARAPQDRYPDAGALARDLDRVARGERPDALAPPTQARLAVALALLCVGLLALIALLLARPRPDAATTVVVTTSTPQGAPAVAPADPLDLLRRGAAQGVVADMAALGSALVAAPDTSQRLEGRGWLERAASGGDADAMLQLGRALLLEAPDDPATVEQGLAWLDRAGKAGRPGAWWIGGRHFEGPLPGRTREDVYGAASAARDPQAALRWWALAADAGDPRAMRKLGEVHEDGWCVAPDDSEAASWYRRAAEKGDGRAMVLLANLLEFSSGPRRDPEQAAVWRARAAEALPAQAEHDPDAAATLGELLLSKDGGAVADPDAAIPWLRLACAGGSAEATVTLGAALLLRPEHMLTPDEGVVLLTRGQGMWRGLGALYLAQAYQTGKGVAVDRARAIEWYERAISLGRASALTFLGDLLLADPAPARRQVGLERLRQAARELQEDAPKLQAARRLVEVLRREDVVPAAPQEALRWAAFAASISDADLGAARGLALALAADPATVATLEALSAGGDALAEHLLGFLAEQAAPPRHAEAAAHFGVAFERGHAESRWYRALALRRAGQHAEASAELRAQAEEGSARAMRVLGQALAEGDGVARDDAAAARWLLRAHDGADERATVFLAELVATGRGVARDHAAALALLERVRPRLVRRGAEAFDVVRRAAALGVELARLLEDEAALTRWLRAGANADEPGCMDEWARRLEAGEGVERDAEAAARLRARRAALPAATR